MMNQTLRRATLAFLATGALGACQSLGSLSFLRLGSVDRKEVLVEEVKEVRAQQIDSEAHFRDTFQGFRDLITANAAELEEHYATLQDEVELCESDLKQLRGHIRSLNKQGESLFADWTAELEEFTSAQLRDKSAALLADTQERHSILLVELERTAAAVEPVIKGLNDYVLFFNHNLSPHGIGALRDTYGPFAADLSALQKQIRSAVSATDDFLRHAEGRIPPRPAEPSNGS